MNKNYHYQVYNEYNAYNKYLFKLFLIHNNIYVCLVNSIEQGVAFIGFPGNKRSMFDRLPMKC